MKHGRNEGVTLVEVLTVVIILSILSVGISNYALKYAGEKRGEINATDFWLEMNNLRSRVLKEGSPLIVSFDFDSSTYEIYIDSNDNSVIDTNEVAVEGQVKPRIVIGLPSPSPTSRPPGVADLNIVSASWKDGIRIDNNATLTFPPGYLYIQSESRKNIGYCLTVPAGESEVHFYKWNGSKWYKF